MPNRLTSLSKESEDLILYFIFQFLKQLFDRPCPSGFHVFQAGIYACQYLLLADVLGFFLLFAYVLLQLASHFLLLSESDWMVCHRLSNEMVAFICRSS